MIWNCRKLRFTCLFILCIPSPPPSCNARRDDGPNRCRFEKARKTLDNGLDVIYAPLHQAPAVHVRVLYHVGSRDEKADRQGFAHMFEHMMFRGSSHVAPEQHMKMIGVAGGDSNAFTSYDQTTYVNTIPSNAVQMALYLEADRMASFKVNDDIFQTERKVVAEEWQRMPLAPTSRWGRCSRISRSSRFKSRAIAGPPSATWTSSARPAPASCSDFSIHTMSPTTPA